AAAAATRETAAATAAPRAAAAATAAPRAAAATTAAPEDRRVRAPAAAVGGDGTLRGSQGAEDRHAEDAEEQREQEDGGGIGRAPWRGATRRRRSRTTADAREHGVHRGVETGGVALLTEARCDDVADDRRGDGVGDHRLETVADLDPQLPLLQKDDEEDAVAEALAADLPPLFEPDGDVLDAVALERGKDRHEHLDAAPALT